jgi:flagellar basal-body rod protein FlgC
MSLFGAIQTSGSGLRVFRTWMDAVSDNIANLNTVRSTDGEAFRARYVVARSVGSGAEAVTGARAGTEVAGIEFGDAEGRLVHQPDHPLADEDGMVRYPSTDLGDQMTQLLVAQRGYQVNLAVVDRVKDAYQQALQIGK